MLAARPDIASRVEALLTVAGALQGSPLADDLHGLYGMTVGIFPFEGLRPWRRRPGRRPQTRGAREWWARAPQRVTTPVYSLVTLPDFDRLSLSLILPYAWLSSYSPDNDGMLRVQDQVIPSSRLLGIVNADHLTVAIPYPGIFMSSCGVRCRFRARRCSSPPST